MPKLPRPVTGLLAAVLAACALSGCASVASPSIEMLEREWAHGEARITFADDGTWSGSALPSAMIAESVGSDGTFEGGGTWSADDTDRDDQVITLTAPSGETFELHLIYDSWRGYQVETPPGGAEIAFTPR
ncbi:hypothetical protein [Naasia lichenicola]|uniref:Uncharacterized protein n=1 Tax=Naasia lichenicola TaxID=2565933 RepID=A0A4S4FI85_9MICO|nr:hypothetical protein [Naasia lichenicola]THG30053.1 hypothetical protein E6C64_15560 [Naasia lichenicola]